MIILSCSSIFLVSMLLSFLIFFMISKNRNIIFFISILFGFIVSIIFNILEQSNLISIKSIVNLFTHLFKNIQINISQISIEQFSKAMCMITIFLITFIISFSVSSFVIYKIRDNEKRNRSYYFTKSIFISLNLLSTLFTLLFFITTLNIPLQLYNGFLTYLFELIRGLIYSL